jgi:hypothetical protein
MSCSTNEFLNSRTDLAAGDLTFIQPPYSSTKGYRLCWRCWRAAASFPRAGRARIPPAIPLARDTNRLTGPACERPGRADHERGPLA